MDFRPDNIADVLGLILGSILLLMSHIFVSRMERSGATAWESLGKKIRLAAILFTVGMMFTLSTIFFQDRMLRESMNLTGNIFWLMAIYFVYDGLQSLWHTMEVIFGGWL